MTVPTTKEQFKWYCMRALGHPVINIELDQDQIDDRVDQSLKYYYDHHFDGSDKMFYKWQVTANDFPDVVKTALIANGGVGYSNSDYLTFTPVNGAGNNGTANVTTDSNGTIISVSVSNVGKGFQLPPSTVITTSTGSQANVVAQLGGYIDVPQNVIGVINIFDISSAIAASNFFSIQYQIALNDLYSFFTQSLVPYYTTRMHLNQMEELLVGKQPLRYNRHQSKMYLDWDWNRINIGNFLILECYEIIDPNLYPAVWSDYWLQRYTIQQLKMQWGSNLKKYGNMTMPGGVIFNGQQIYNEAANEILRLENEMINSYSPILAYMTG